MTRRSVRRLLFFLNTCENTHARLLGDFRFCSTCSTYLEFLFTCDGYDWMQRLQCIVTCGIQQLSSLYSGEALLDILQWSGTAKCFSVELLRSVILQWNTVSRRTSTGDRVMAVTDQRSAELSSSQSLQTPTFQFTWLAFFQDRIVYAHRRLNLNRMHVTGFSCPGLIYVAKVAWSVGVVVKEKYESEFFSLGVVLDNELCVWLNSVSSQALHIICHYRFFSLWTGPCVQTKLKNVVWIRNQGEIKDSRG